MKKTVNEAGNEGGSVTEGLPEFVYFVYSAGRIKIGYTTDIYTRLANLKNMGGSDIELIAVLPGDRAFEKMMHRTFKADRLHGEWFRLSDEIRRFLGCIDEACDGTMTADVRLSVGSCLDRLSQAEARQ